MLRELLYPKHVWLSRCFFALQEKITAKNIFYPEIILTTAIVHAIIPFAAEKAADRLTDTAGACGCGTGVIPENRITYMVAWLSW